MLCLAGEFKKYNDGLIPRGGVCRSCQHWGLWGDYIKGAYRRSAGGVRDPGEEEEDTNIDRLQKAYDVDGDVIMVSASPRSTRGEENGSPSFRNGENSRKNTRHKKSTTVANEAILSSESEGASRSMSHRHRRLPLNDDEELEDFSFIMDLKSLSDDDDDDLLNIPFRRTTLTSPRRSNT